MRFSIIHRLLRFSLKHPIPVFAAILLITAFMGYFALQIQINPDVAGLIPKDEEITRMREKYQKDFQAEADYLVFGVSGEDLFTIEKLNAYYNVIRQIEAIPIVASSINPFSMVTFEKSDQRLKIVPLAPEKRAPNNKEELARFKERILKAPFAENLVISEDGSVLCTFFTTEAPKDHVAFMKEVRGIIKTVEDDFNIYITGSHAFETALRLHLSKDLSILLVLALLIIMVVYYLGFRAKRAALLTIAVVFFGTVWCLGFMRLVGFPISIVSIVTPPLVLTLGSSYCIHILNQYYRESSGHEKETERISRKEWIAGAVANVNKTVFMAAITTIIGLCSLLATKLAPTREFGIATSVGVISCAVLSFFFIPAVLSFLRSPTSEQRKKVLKGFLTTCLKKLSVGVIRWRLVIAALLVLIVAAFGISLRYLQYKTDVVSYFPRNEKVIEDTSYLTKKIGGFQEIFLTITVPEDKKNYFLQNDVVQVIARFEEELNRMPDISKIYSFPSYLKGLNSIMTGEKKVPESRGLILLLSRYIKALTRETSPEANMIVNVANQDFTRLDFSLWIFDHETNNIISDYKLRKLVDEIDQLIEEHIPQEATAELWGDHLRFLVLSDIIRSDQRTSMAISIGLIFILTALVFRSIWYGFLSLIPLLTGIMLNFVFMVILGIPMDMTTIMFSIVVIGVGVDNSIHFLINFRRQRSLHPRNFQRALTQTFQIAGRPIILTTASVIGGLLVFCFASFQPIIYFGLLVVMALFTAAVGTLVILPFFLSIGKGKEFGR